MPGKGSARRSERSASVPSTPFVPAELGTPLGIPPSEAQAQLTSDSYKELVNKISWVLGSTYRVNYSNRLSVARQVATRVAAALVKECGYPRSIAKVDPQPGQP